MIRVCICLDYDVATPEEAYASLYRDLGPDEKLRSDGRQLDSMPFGPDFEGWESCNSDWFDDAGKEFSEEEVEAARNKFWANYKEQTT